MGSSFLESAARFVDPSISCIAMRSRAAGVETFEIAELSGRMTSPGFFTIAGEAWTVRSDMIEEAGLVVFKPLR